jgi:hypothetical protein
MVDALRLSTLQGTDVVGASAMRRRSRSTSPATWFAAEKETLPQILIRVQSPNKPRSRTTSEYLAISGLIQERCVAEEVMMGGIRHTDVPSDFSPGWPEPASSTPFRLILRSDRAK